MSTMGQEEKGLITRGRFEPRYRGTVCLNCGQPLDLTDKYCPHCSQANSTKKLTLKDFLDEFLSDIINYDSKLLKTLYTMMVRPGTITKDYINGKRISYTNPFRFLLSLAFLYFLMFAYTSNFSKLDELHLDEKIKKTNGINFTFNDGSSAGDSTQKPKKLRDFIPIDSLDLKDPTTKKELQQLDSLEAFVADFSENERRSDSLKKSDPKTYIAEMYRENEQGFFKYVDFFITQIREDSLANFEESKTRYGIKESFKSKLAFNASSSILRAVARPGSWLSDTISKLPLVVFFFLPVFTVFVLMAYVRKKYTYTDHLIFSFHNQSLLFILLILSWIVDFIFGTSTSVLALILFAIYLFQAMRKFYGQGFFKTLIKYMFLNMVFTFLAFIAIVLLSLGSVVTY